MEKKVCPACNGKKWIKTIDELTDKAYQQDCWICETKGYVVKCDVCQHYSCTCGEEYDNWADNQLSHEN